MNREDRANTYYWIDPQEELIGVLMAQFQPDWFFPIAPGFRVAAYQATVDCQLKSY